MKKKKPPVAQLDLNYVTQGAMKLYAVLILYQTKCKTTRIFFQIHIRILTNTT